MGLDYDDFDHRWKLLSNFAKISKHHEFFFNSFTPLSDDKETQSRMPVEQTGGTPFPLR